MTTDEFIESCETLMKFKEAVETHIEVMGYEMTEKDKEALLRLILISARGLALDLGYKP